MTPGGYRRFVRREGRAAVLHEFETSGSDEFGDPTSVTETTTDTHALVRLRGGEGVTVTVAGETVEIDAEIIVPDDLDVTPESTRDRPELEVGGARYKVWAVDDTAVSGGRRLLATRK